jgi:hypothetical protein
MPKTIIKRVCLAGYNEYSKAPQLLCYNCTLNLNKRGNWEVDKTPFRDYFESRFKSVYLFSDIQHHKIVFNRDFECISHQPSKRYTKHNFNITAVEPF